MGILKMKLATSFDEFFYTLAELGVFHSLIYLSYKLLSGLFVNFHTSHNSTLQSRIFKIIYHAFRRLIL